MFISTPSFTQQTCKFIIKKIQSLKTRLDVWNQSSSASTKMLKIGVLSEILQSVFIEGEMKGRNLSTLAVHGYFSHLVSISLFHPHPHPIPKKNLLGVIERK